MSRRWSHLTVEVKASWTGIGPADIQNAFDRRGAPGRGRIDVAMPASWGKALLIFKKEQQACPGVAVDGSAKLVACVVSPPC